MTLKKLEIGKLYKLKCDSTLFVKSNDEFVWRDAGHIFLYIEFDQFLDVKNNILLASTSRLFNDPESYLYLLEHDGCI